MAAERQRRSGFYMVLMGLLLSPMGGQASSIQKIEVFTASTVPVTFSQAELKRLNISFSYFVLDKSRQVEKALSTGLRNKPGLSRQKVIQRVNRSGVLGQVMNSYQGILKAQQYGLTRYPAIVFNGQSVIYGVPDVHRALLIYRKKHGL